MGVVQGASPSQQVSAASNRATQSLARIAGRWLQWQCQLLSQVHFAAIVDVTDLNSGSGIHSKTIIHAVGAARVPLIALGSADDHVQKTARGVTYWQVPVTLAGRSLCVLVHIAQFNKAERDAADQLLRWGALNLAAWFADGLNEHASDSPAQVTPSIPPLRVMLKEQTLEYAAARWVDDLQRRTPAVRISVGWYDGGRTCLLAVSGVPALDVRRTFPRALISAFDECVAAVSPIVYPSDTASTMETIAHQRLHQGFGEHRILSIPLVHDGQAVGALLMEFKLACAIDERINAVLDEVALATPVLMTVSERKTGVARFFKRRLRRTWRALVQPATPIQHALRVSVGAVAFVALFFPFPDTVSVHGNIQGSDRQVLSAQYEGFLSSALARAGDQVKAGQVLAQFDHSRLQLERDTWVSELTRLDAALVQAMSTRDRAVIGRLRAEQTAARAERELIDLKITQADIVSPIDGILVSGDLDERLGSSVAAGESLFQIASLNNYTLQLEVPERYAAQVTQGSGGTMRFAAFPSDSFAFSIDSFVPVAVSKEGENVFRSEASLLGDAAAIRPGMSGVAKIDLGTRSVLRRAIDFLQTRLRYWWWAIGA